MDSVFTVATLAGRADYRAGVTPILVMFVFRPTRCIKATTRPTNITHCADFTGQDTLAQKLHSSLPATHRAVLTSCFSLLASRRHFLSHFACSFMHCVTLAELSAILSQHGPDLIASGTAIRAESVTCYWATSRKRLASWHHALARRRELHRRGRCDALRFWWDHNMPLLEEIIASEMLTRVLASLTAQIESKTHRDEVSPVTHSIYLSHLDASHRVVQMMIGHEGYAVEHVVRLNRLRKGVERWTDALIGRMSIELAEGLAFAFDFERSRSFSREARDCGVGTARTIHCWLMNASMREMLCQRTSDRPAFASQNKDVADAVMMMLQSELLDDFGTIRSGWTHRIGN